MRLDQREAQLGWRAFHHRLHAIEQLLDARKRPHGGRLFRDPRRIFEDIGQRSDELFPAARIQLGEALRHDVLFVGLAPIEGQAKQAGSLSFRLRAALPSPPLVAEAVVPGRLSHFNE
jgi:hypothetical protein